MFDALLILKPGWYFNHKEAINAWPDYREMNKVEKEILVPDERYRIESGFLADLAYQSLQKQVSDCKQFLKRSKTHPFDEYRFIARYFNKIWLFYFFAHRIIRFYNPVLELIGLLGSLNIKRTNWNETKGRNVLLKDELSESPRVAVIIPTLDRFEHLDRALDDLYNQDYLNMEIIVVDQSDRVPPGFMDKHKDKIIYIHQKEKALWLARNFAIESTNAEYILLFDDDSRVSPDWISMHLKCLERYDAHISSGVSLSKIGDVIPENYRSFRLSDQLDTGNVMIKREVFRKIGLFDRQFEKQRMGDGEYGLRALIAGFKNVSNPLAARIHLKVHSGGLRQHGHWDGWRPTSWFAPRPIPSVLYLFRNYWGNKVAIRYIKVNILPSVLSYQSKGKKWKLLLYIPVFPLILLGLTYQVYRSWKIAGKMIRQGSLIKYFPDTK